MPTRISYDGMSRLTAAGYLENGKLNNHFSTSYKYDIMGNILSLRREGLLDSGDYGTIDDLTYSYEGNQVVKIDDAADESPSYSGAMHFRDAANEETEYTYDANGNMLTDSNKGITSIEYNVLDLPQCINIKPNVLGNSDNNVCYTYSADGTKLRSTYKKGNSQVLPYKPTPSSNIKTNGMVTPTVKTFESNYHYCSNLVYNNDRLSTILFDGGYASVDEGGGLVMHYYVKDHLGSNRLVVDGNGNIEEVNHYYPFGALMGDRCGVSRNKYKYIGKELDTMYGWNMQDHGARWYDPVSIIWRNQDPKAEKDLSTNPYVSCNDNPLLYIDDNGKETKVGIETIKLGHTFLVVQNERLVVYTYGRFLEGDKHKKHFSFTDPTGLGVLLRLEGKEALAYINKETNKYGARYYAVRDVDDSKILKYMDSQFYGGRELSLNEKKIMANKGFNPNSARVIDKYNLIENNCTTKSVDALIHGGTKLKFLIQKIQFTDGKSMPFIKTEPIYSPRDLKDFLNENNK